MVHLDISKNSPESNPKINAAWNIKRGPPQSDKRFWLMNFDSAGLWQAAVSCKKGVWRGFERSWLRMTDPGNCLRGFVWLAGGQGPHDDAEADRDLD